MTEIYWLLLVISAWAGLMLLLFIAYGSTLRALWHEPLLRHPVLIIESDDWGAGPPEQAEPLRQLTELLTNFHDTTGRPPMMTLALVLAVADGPAIRASGRYQRRTLQDPLFTPLREAITEGVDRGVFALQLHGLEHYWPETLMSSRDDKVQHWLREETPQPTEPLPSHLQSRWIDASVLPSRPLPDTAIRAAVNEEIGIYQQIFGDIPKVVVPPTFVWSTTVEAAWAKAGVEYVVTPGQRNSCRNESGKPDCHSGKIRNGERGDALAGAASAANSVSPQIAAFAPKGAPATPPHPVGAASAANTTPPTVNYIVRDDYFEPMMGHTAQKALAALAHKRQLARPCLLETHRANFTGTAELAQRSMQELSKLLQKALEHHPDVRFISTEALGRAMRTNDPAWVEQRLGCRLAVMAKRITEIPRLGKLARLSGLILMLTMSAALLRQHPQTNETPAT